MAKQKVNYARRTAKYFNFMRKVFQRIVTNVWYCPRFKLIYKLKIEGKENIPHNSDFIACGNHLSNLDPYIITYIMPKPVAFMAKKELFEKAFTRWMLDWQGAFAVNREKLEVSTIKTALEVKNTDWILGLFPQGTRAKSGTIGIVGSEKTTWLPFKGNITVKIGELIPYDEDLDAVMEKWARAIQELTGFTYIPNPA